MGNIIEITEETFNSEVLEKDGLVLVDFWAPWCGPCRMQTPILEKIIESGKINASIVKCNTDEAVSVAQKMNISSIPTLILFKDGKEQERFVGVQPENVLLEKLS